MTDDTDTDVPVTPAQFDAFGALLSLLHLIGNVQLYEGRLKALQRAQAGVEKEQRLLARERLAAVAEQTKAKEEIAREMQALLRRRVSVAEAERGLEEAKQEIADFRRGQDARRYEKLPGGGLRDHGVDGLMLQPRPADSHFDRASSSAAEEHSEIERVPGAGHTLSRSVSKPKRSLRRVQPDA